MSDVQQSKPASISRRTLIVSGVGLAALLSGGYLTRGLWNPVAVEEAVITVVQRIFGRDIGPRVALRQFAAFYVERRRLQGWMGDGERVLFSSAQSFPPIRGLANMFDLGNDRVAQMEDDIGQLFLRNTNWTYRAAEEPLMFAEQINGHNTCNDPLARFSFED